MSAAIRLTLVLVVVQRSVASLTQESPPHPSPHALHHHRLRAAARRGGQRAEHLRAFTVGRYEMLRGRSGGGPKPSKWRKSASHSFVAFFGKRSGAPVRPMAPVEEQEQAPSASGSEAACSEPEWDDGVFGVQGRYAVPDDEATFGSARSPTAESSASEIDGDQAHPSFDPRPVAAFTTSGTHGRMVFVCGRVWFCGLNRGFA